VDNDKDLTDLYMILLKARGYRVRAFNDRAEALAALEKDERKPDLLIMDYLGHLMPLDQFVHRSLAAHPTLRILMASGLSPAEARLSSARLDRFIQKPFTGEELLKEVRTTLAA
jgi:DNA-binding response OmpR family regulator